MSVRDLGFHMDNELKSGMHVNKLTSALFITIKRIASIQHLLDEETMKICCNKDGYSQIHVLLSQSCLLDMIRYNMVSRVG